MGAPVVTPRTRFILLNQSILGSSMYLDATDPDGDPITQYRFTDLLSSSTSGFIRYNGVPQPNGSTFTVSAGNLSKVTFTAGSVVSTENVRIEVFANGQWSSPVSSLMYFVRDNVVAPIITVTNPSVLQDELVSITSFMSAADPDGWPIEKFYVRDQLAGPNSGELRLNGVVQPQGVWQYVSAADIGGLQYFARNHTENERLEFFAWDGAKWSPYTYANPIVRQNINAPVAFYGSMTVRADQSNAISSALGWNDSDGSTIKWIEFFDTNSASTSGNLERSGTILAPGIWHRVNIGDLATMRFFGAKSQTDDIIKYRVFDGSHVSASADLLLRSIEPPKLSSGAFHNSTLINMPVKDMFVKLDTGPTLVSYEVIDLNTATLSGSLRLGSQTLAAGQIHALSTSQLNQLQFRTGRPEARSDDRIMLRTFNGSFWSAWSSINIKTEPYYRHALKFLDNPFDLSSMESNTWLDWTPLVQPDPLLLSYSFMEEYPFYHDGFDGAAADNFSQFTVQQRSMARETFRQVSELTYMQFEEQPDSSTNTFGGPGGIIRMGNYANPDGDAAAYASPPGPGFPNGDIWMNVAFTSTFVTQPGSYTFGVFEHELGHVMGMKHPHNGGTPLLPAATDSETFTVMSYSPRADGTAATYMLYDMVNLQDMYGANVSTRAGDTLYDISGYWGGNSNIITAIWDGGGNDTISVAGALVDSIVDIRQGGYSSFGRVFNPFTNQFIRQQDQLAVAFNVDIENAIGSSNNDTVFGNHLNNILNGGDGNDEIFSFAGDDTMIGAAGDDTYHWGAGDGNDFIDEQKKAGRDRIVLDSFPALNSFTDDLSFRRLGRDLIVELALDNALPEASLRISNQEWGSYRIETLRLGGSDIDLLSVFAQTTASSTRFQLAGGSSIFGLLATPV